MHIRTSGRVFWCSVGAALIATAGVALPAAQATNTGGGGAGQVFVSIVPCRLLDTRGPANIGPRSSPLGAGDIYIQAVTGTNGECTIPAQATGVAMNVTTVNGTADSYLTLWPADAARPLASNLNWKAGDGATPNKVDVKLSADGRISMFNNAGTVDVIGDVVGYYADHNHDDRYYTKAEVDAAVNAAVTQPRVHHDHYSAFSVMFLSGSGSGIANCISPTAGPPYVPLVVPEGARLTSIEIDTLDGPTAALYSVKVVKYTANATGATLAILDTDQAGSSTASPGVRVHHVLIPSVPEVIESGETLVLEPWVNNGTDAFCGATVNYETVG